LTAAEKHQPSRVKRLLALGAEIRCTDEHGVTPLHQAAKDHRKDTIEVLLQAGAKVGAETKCDNTPLCHSGITPLHWAVLYSHDGKRPEHVEALIQAGADVNHMDERGTTPLHAACSKEIVEALLRAGADVHSRDHHGRTPLHSARSAKIAEALLRAGADVNSRCLRNVTPLHLVWHHRRDVIELAEVLVDAGADLNACADFCPKTPTRADDPARTPLAWVQIEPPRIRCGFGPTRSRRTTFDRLKAEHTELVLFLQRHGGEAECEEKYAISIC
jgi:ankyrin repeat protein